MKLRGIESTRVRREWSKDMLRQEQEPEGFFDYERDTPLEVREKFEKEFLDDENRWVAMDAVIGQMLKNPSLIQSIDLLEYAKKKLSEYLEPESFRKISESAVADVNQQIFMVEKIFDMLNFLGLTSVDFEKLKTKLAKVLSPGNIYSRWEKQERFLNQDIDPDDFLPYNDRINMLFLGFKLFPQQRQECTELAEKFFDEFESNILSECSSLYDMVHAAMDLQKLWFLCPNKRSNIIHIAQEIRKNWMKEIGEKNSYSEIYEVIFLLTMISQFDAELTAGGQIEIREKSKIASGRNDLPERSTL